MALQIGDCVQAGLCRSVWPRHFFSGLAESALSFVPPANPLITGGGSAGPMYQPGEVPYSAGTSGDRTRPPTYPGGAADPNSSSIGSGSIADAFRRAFAATAASAQPAQLPAQQAAAAASRSQAPPLLQPFRNGVEESQRAAFERQVDQLEDAPSASMADSLARQLDSVPPEHRWIDSSWFPSYDSWNDLRSRVNQVKASLRSSGPGIGGRMAAALGPVSAGGGSVPSPVPGASQPGSGVLSESLDALAKLFSAVGPSVPGIVELARKPRAAAPYPTSVPPRAGGSEWLLPVGVLAAGAAVLYFATKGR